MLARRDAALAPLTTLRLGGPARRLVTVYDEASLLQVLAEGPALVLGGGSNIILTNDMPQVVLKVEILGRRLVQETPQAWIVEAGAGENWHEVVAWTLQQGWAGLENLALIPGSVGATPVQNIGAYGMELQDRFDSLDAVDLITGLTVTLGPDDCRFGYRDSVFKHALSGRSLITRVRFALPRPGDRQVLVHHLREVQGARLAPGKDRLLDVGRKKGEPYQPPLIRVTSAQS